MYCVFIVLLYTGVGIWSMHFIGMSAIVYYSQDVQLQFVFDINITIYSLLACISVVTAAFYICGSNESNQLSWYRILLGGLLTGTGVAVMHYVGMMAIIIKPHMSFDVLYVCISCVIGIVASTAALVIFFKLESMWKTNIYGLIGCSCIMGVAVNLMHYIGMVACVFYDSTSYPPPDVSHYTASITMLYISLGVASLITLLLLCFTLYNAHLNKLDTFKQATLLLYAVVIDSQHNILSTLHGQLPKFVIDTQYLGQGMFDINSRDFLRMYKVMQNYQQHDIMLQELQSRQRVNHYSNTLNNNALGTYNIQLFELFLHAMKQMITDLNIDTAEQKLVMYYQPINNNVIVVSKPRHNYEIQRYTSTGMYKFAPYNIAMNSIDQLINNKLIDCNTMLQQWCQHYDQVMQPLVESHNIPDITNTLYDTTLKRKKLEVSSSVRPSIKSSINSTDDIHINNNPPSIQHICIALLYSRVTPTGVEIMVNQSGSLWLPNIIFQRNTVSNHNVKQLLIDQMTIANWSAQPKFIRQVRLSINNKLNKYQQLSYINTINTAADDSNNHSSCSIQQNTQLIVPLPQQRAVSVQPSVRSIGACNINTDILPMRRLISAPIISNDSQHEFSSIHDIESNTQYLQQWSNAIQQLNELCGCNNTDISGNTLHSIQPIKLDTNISMYLFVVNTMNNNVSTQYNTNNIQYIPLHIFDLYSQYRYNHSMPHNWLKRAVEDKLESKLERSTTIHNSIHQRKYSTYDTVETQNRVDDQRPSAGSYYVNGKYNKDVIISIDDNHKQRVTG